MSDNEGNDAPSPSKSITSSDPSNKLIENAIAQINQLLPPNPKNPLQRPELALNDNFKFNEWRDQKGKARKTPGKQTTPIPPHVKDDFHWFWIEARFFNFQVREDRQDAFNRALEEQGITEDRVKQVTKEKQDDEDFFRGTYFRVTNVSQEDYATALQIYQTLIVFRVHNQWKYFRRMAMEYLEEKVPNKPSAGYKIKDSWLLNRSCCQNGQILKKNRLLAKDGMNSEQFVSAAKNSFHKLQETEQTDVITTMIDVIMAAPETLSAEEKENIKAQYQEDLEFQAMQFDDSLNRLNGSMQAYMKSRGEDPVKVAEDNQELAKLYHTAIQERRREATYRQRSQLKDLRTYLGPHFQSLGLGLDPSGADDDEEFDLGPLEQTEQRREEFDNPGMGSNGRDGNTSGQFHLSPSLIAYFCVRNLKRPNS